MHHREPTPEEQHREPTPPTHHREPTPEEQHREPTPPTTVNPALICPPPASTVPPCPPKAAAWFSDAHTQMTAVDLGYHFNALVAAWTRVEAASKFKAGPTNLPKPGRPTQVSAWIGGGRSARSGKTKVTKVETFEKEWAVWWDSLQPSWRKRDTDGTWSVVGGYGSDGKEWGDLTQWGVNGTLSLVAGLYFWGCAVQDQPTLHNRWEAAVLDVGWMLEGMAAFFEKFNRRF
ncbi:hypothetical protein C8R43DRAFT_906590 [Mycena crocata]|nr:hypothetical protein C8R43DRAFT_906590 [Mycena crocata]